MKTSIATSKLTAVVEKLGFEVKSKASSFKVWPKGGNMKRSLDISTNKHGNTVQVLLVGFTVTEDVKVLAHPPASTATQVLDMDGKDELNILRTFMKLCRDLEHLVAPPAPVVASPPESNEAPIEQPIEQPVEELVAASA